MSDDRPDADEILRSLQLLRSPDSADRRKGIQILGGLADDPRVLQVFEYLYQIDPDPEVRDMAWQAILGQGPSVPAPGPEETTRGSISAAQPPANGSGRRLFLMNPANTKLIASRARQSQRRGRIASWLAILLLFVAGVFWGLVIPDWITWYEFRQEAVTTQGEVISREVRDEEHYVVIYRFAVGQVEEETFYSGEMRVSRALYTSLAEDAPVEVTYLPDNPYRSRLEDEHNPAYERRSSFTVVAAGLTVMIGLLWAISALQRQIPDRDKHLLRGQIVSSSGHEDDDGDFNVKLRYSFQTPVGRTITDQTSRIRNDLKTSSLPVPGTPIAVYYRHDHSYRLL